MVNPGHVENPTYNRNDNDDREVYEDVQARDMVQSLDGQAYADVAAVKGAAGDGGYEQPASTYA